MLKFEAEREFYASPALEFNELTGWGQEIHWKMKRCSVVHTMDHSVMPEYYTAAIRSLHLFISHCTRLSNLLCRFFPMRESFGDGVRVIVIRLLRVVHFV